VARILHRLLAAAAVVVGSLVFLAPAASAAATTSTDPPAYWLVASDGGIFSFGGAQFYGSMGGRPLNQPIVGMAPTGDGGGYWEVASDGGIFAFGDAQFYGSMGGRPLNRPVVGMAAVPGGGGYWLVASDGGIFAFGDAQFYGSTGNLTLNEPIVAMTPSPDGAGYWFTAADGGIFAYGDSEFYGSLGGVPQSRPIVAMAGTPRGRGYWLTNNNGAVTDFGTAPYLGSAPQVLNAPIVAMAETPGTGQLGSITVPSGSYGYDISNYQCTGLPPAPHAIGVVETNGHGTSAPNPCLGQEAAWAGGGLNLYTFLTCTDNGTNSPTCTYTSGFQEAEYAFTVAQTAGADTGVPWWLDVEGKTWSQTTRNANALLVQGAIAGLRYEGINSVGIYASPAVWPTIVGTFQPSVPYWAADWGLDPSTTCTDIHGKYQDLPAGPVALVQYSSPSYPYEAGGMTTRYDNDYAC
jgi:hypothetical protein